MGRLAVRASILVFALTTSLTCITTHAETTSSTTTPSTSSLNPALNDGIPPITDAGSALPSTSMTTVETSWYKSVLGNTSVTLFSEWYGPSAGNPNSNLVNDYGQLNGYKTFFDSSMIFLYNINGSSWQVGGAYNFAFTPVTGLDIMTEDPYLKVGNKKLIKTGNFTMGADLRFYPGVTPLSEQANQLAYIRSVQVMNYDIPNSKFSLSNLSWVRYYIFGNRGQAIDFGNSLTGPGIPYETANFQISTIPGISYQALPNLGITVQYEMDTYQLLGNSVLNWSSPNSSTGLYGMVSWDLNKHVNLNPFIEAQTGGRIAWDTTMLGAYITAKLL